MPSVRLIVSGRVHGVFYRASVRDEAERLGVNGYVRNLPDETVEVIASGDPETVERFIAFCRENPGASHVDEVKVERLSHTDGVMDRFMIIR